MYLNTGKVIVNGYEDREMPEDAFYLKKAPYQSLLIGFGAEYMITSEISLAYNTIFKFSVGTDNKYNVLRNKTVEFETGINYNF
ncbi:MAG: hypothetical protein JXA77_05525 [Bacteroidales bacterium]|nr:hypothetical protein [Bacteroidales bacterium]MBN2818058.1 hypothetical protein [Bacteroidales bacterium]